MTAAPGGSEGAMVPRAARPALVRAYRRGVARGLVALERAELREATLTRLGWVGAVTAAVLVGAVLVGLRLLEGVPSSASGALARAAGIVLWVGAVPVALAAAGDGARRDRERGITALAGARGASSELLTTARAVAAMVEVGLVAGLPLVTLALVTAALDGLRGVPQSLAAALALVVFSIACGVVLGGLASACAGAARARGRLVFLIVLIGPLAAADLVHKSSWSIPGALRAVVSAGLELARGAS